MFKHFALKGTILSLALALLAGCGGGSGSSNQPAAAPVQKSAVDMPSVATVTGNVTFEGKAPAAEKIEMSSDPACSTKHKGKVDAGDVLIKGGKVANVIVYVKTGLEKYSFPANTQMLSIDQNGCMYSPHVAAIQLGQPLEIVNSDKTLHNVHAMIGDKTLFNSAMPTKGMKMPESISEAGMVTIKCDVHSWMKGYIGVFENPCFAVTGSNGSFTINSLPAGTYTLVAWHEKLGTVEQTVTVGAKDKKTVNFVFKM